MENAAFTPADTPSVPKKSSKKSAAASHPSPDEITSKLTGRTLMCYFLLLNKGSIGVRELQRTLGLSSPSVSRYHLDKLVELHLVENSNGVYSIIKKADLPVLASWVLIGKFLVPRMLFGAVFFTLLFIGYLAFFYRFWNTDSFFVILFGVLASLYCWGDVIWHLAHHPIRS